MARRAGTNVFMIRASASGVPSLGGLRNALAIKADQANGMG